MKQYKDFYNEGLLHLWIDICTFCNAGCPECHRTDIVSGGLGKVDWLPLIQWNLDQFKSAYTPELIKRSSVMEICGTWGDPVMVKDLLEIAEYAFDCNPNLHLSIDTNGSIRSKSWWRKFGQLAKKIKTEYQGEGRLQVDFAVEGVTPEMQNRYRRKTDLYKILANMQAFVEGGEGHSKATVFCVVHKHNQNYLDEIKDLTKQYGATSWFFPESNRFNSGPRFEFKNEHGEDDFLEQVDDSYKAPKNQSVIVDWKRQEGLLTEIKEKVRNISENDDE